MMQSYTPFTGVSCPLETQRCIYLDGLTDTVSIDLAFASARKLFGMLDYDVVKILIGNTSKSGFKTYSVKKLISEIQTGEVDQFKFVEFYPNKRSSIDESWMPDIYFSVTQQYRVNSMFFCYNSKNDSDVDMQILEVLREVSDYCAGYIYDFPTVFSPLAYWTGIVVDPSDRRVGEIGDRECRRIENWRQNTEIGFMRAGERVFLDPCQGYVRDAYPKLILSKPHCDRRFNGKSILELAHEVCGSTVLPYNEKVILITDDSKIMDLQKLLDKCSMTLSINHSS